MCLIFDHYILIPVTIAIQKYLSSREKYVNLPTGLVFFAEIPTGLVTGYEIYQ